MRNLIEDISENNSPELKFVKEDRDFWMKEAIINQKKLYIAMKALWWYSENALHEHADKAIAEIEKIK